MACHFHQRPAFTRAGIDDRTAGVEDEMPAYLLRNGIWQNFRGRSTHITYYSERSRIFSEFQNSVQECCFLYSTTYVNHQIRRAMLNTRDAPIAGRIPFFVSHTEETQT